MFDTGTDGEERRSVGVSCGTSCLGDLVPEVSVCARRTESITLDEGIVGGGFEFRGGGGFAGCDGSTSTIILCLHTGVGCFTEVWIVCWTEPFTFLVAGTTSSVCTVSIELVYVSCENGVVSTVGRIGWFSKSETLVGDTTTDCVSWSADGDGGSCGTVNSSGECEGIYGTTRVNCRDTGWKSGTGTTSDGDCWSSGVSRSSSGDFCKSTSSV